MTQTSAFHFESLVWDWPIAIYLFLIGISAGLVTLAVLLRRFYPQAGGADSKVSLSDDITNQITNNTTNINNIHCSLNA